MSRIELLPPPPEACLEKAYSSSQKGGTLIAAGVIDLETHERLLCDPDQYRPAMCLNCCHEVLHVHDYRGRTLRGELERVVVLVLRYRCANPDCRARWQVLPEMIARHLQRTWAVVEAAVVEAAMVEAAVVEAAVVEAAVVGERKTRRRRIPRRTTSRWKSRLGSSAGRMVKVLAASGERHWQLLAATVGQHVSRARLVEKFRRGLAELAELVHRLGAGSPAHVSASKQWPGRIPPTLPSPRWYRGLMSQSDRIEEVLSLDEIGECYGDLRLVNPRAEKQMQESLERYGQMSPVVVCRGATDGYELLDGFKRLRASRRIGSQRTLRARVLKVGARAAKAAVLCLNWVTQSVSDLEEGWVVHALCRSDGLTQVEVGHLLGRGQSWVSRRLSLVERLSDEVQSQLRLGLITGSMGRELARMPRGIQERLLEAITEHGLGSREVAGLVDLVREASVEEQARILRSPREALATREKGKAPTEVRDPRLAEAGNQLLLELSRMERSCARVVSTVGVQGLSHLRRGDLLVLAPALGQAERAGQQASGMLRDALSLAQGEQDADVHQP